MTKYKINKGLISQKLDKETVIFDADKSVLFTFNETVSFIFAKLKSGWDKEKTVSGLVKKYDVEKKEAEKDVAHLITKMKKKKIIV